MIEVRIGPSTYHLTGRSEQIVAWVLHNSERVSRPSKLQLTFDCAGPAVHVELKEREQVTAHN